MLAALALALLALAPAEDSSASFARAVEAYRAGDYATARALWTRLLLDGDGIDRASVLYDLGNVAFREGRPLEAAGWYEACLRAAPRHPEARANRELARSKAGVEPSDRGDLTATIGRIARGLDRAESEWLALAAALASAALVALHAVRGGAALRRAALAAVAATGLALGPWVLHLREDGRQPMLVIAPGGATLRSEPRESAAALSELAPASEVERIDAAGSWVRVQGGEGRRGWVERSAVLPLAPPWGAPAGRP